VHNPWLYIEPIMIWTFLPVEIPAPLIEFCPYPSEPIAFLLFFQSVDLTKTDLYVWIDHDEFGIHAKAKQLENAPLSEIMSFVGMENLVTPNRVFGLLSKFVLPIDTPIPELPSIFPAGEELYLSPGQITDMSAEDLYPLPAEFADDLGLIVAAYKSMNPGGPPPFFDHLATPLARKLANRLIPHSAPEPEPPEP
jgi:hypothetical protein